MSDKDLIIEVNGLTIKSKSIYKITGKLDKDAPNGFVKEGTTKLPSLGIGNTVPCRYVITNKATQTGVFDTGFYEESPCYSNLDKEKVREKVEILRKNVVEPYERKHGKGILDHKNEDFWKDFGVNLFDGRFLVTDNVDDLLELYIAMLGYELTPKSAIGNPKYKESQYCIEDKAEARTIKDERADNIMTAITNFGILLATKKNLLINILKYINLIGVTDNIDPITLKSSFYEWLNKSEDNPKIFQKAFELTENVKTSEVIDLFVLVNKLAKKGILKKENGEYTYGGKNLGADLKTVANNLNSKQELQDVKIDLLEIK